MHVHLSNLAAQTGASLFLHTHSAPFPILSPSHDITPPTHSWTYNKTENLTPAQLTSAPITHAIAESASMKPKSALGFWPASGFADSEWTVVGAVDGFDRWTVDRSVFDAFVKDGIWEGLQRILGLLKMEKSRKLVILERK